MWEIAKYPLFMGEGPQAESVVLLWWILFGISAFVLCVVSFFTFWAIFRKKGEKLTSDEALGRGLGWGVGITISLLLVIIISTFKLSQPLKENGEPAKIEVVGKMWWWEVIYRDDNGAELFRSANEIVLPVGEATKLKILSDTVIHSFWVPALAGKMDMIPGRVNFLSLKPKTEGVFRGQCAEFCGIQHALMAFFVKVKSKENYEKWIKAQQKKYSRPLQKTALAGEKVFLKSGCAKCHSIRGLNQAKDIKERGPDLTHLATRESLAAGSLLNTRGHLAGWIADPQSAKPGNYMPPTKLTTSDFKALLAFLEGLK